MKKIVSLPLIAFTKLIANESPDPCCPPVQEVASVCYSPAYQGLDCNWGLSVRGDFLYWAARESAFAYCVKATTLGNTGLPNNLEMLVPVKNYYLPTKWSPGFRVGLGYTTSCDGWDLELLWTRFHSHTKGTTTVPKGYMAGSDPRFPGVNEECLINPWTHVAFYAGTLFSFDQVSNKWKLKFDQLDLDIGKQYWVSPCFTLRPYGGIRAAWIHSNYTLSSERNFAVPSIGGPALFKDFLKANTWGVGLLGGAQSSWFFSSCFSLFLNIDAALLWSELNSKREFQDTLINTPQNAFVHFSWPSKFHLLQPALDLGIGLRWLEDWCCNRFRTSIDVSWEQHIWFNYVYRYNDSNTFLDSSKTPIFLGFSGIDQQGQDLNMMGLVVSAKLEF